MAGDRYGPPRGVCDYGHRERFSGGAGNLYGRQPRENIAQGFFACGRVKGFRLGGKPKNRYSLVYELLALLLPTAYSRDGFLLLAFWSLRAGTWLRGRLQTTSCLGESCSNAVNTLSLVDNFLEKPTTIRGSIAMQNDRSLGIHAVRLRFVRTGNDAEKIMDHLDVATESLAVVAANTLPNPIGRYSSGKVLKVKVEAAATTSSKTNICGGHPTENG